MLGYTPPAGGFGITSFDRPPPIIPGAPVSPRAPSPLPSPASWGGGSQAAGPMFAAMASRFPQLAGQAGIGAANGAVGGMRPGRDMRFDKDAWHAARRDYRDTRPQRDIADPQGFHALMQAWRDGMPQRSAYMFGAPAAPAPAPVAAPMPVVPGL